MSSIERLKIAKPVKMDHTKALLQRNMTDKQKSDPDGTRTRNLLLAFVIRRLETVSVPESEMKEQGESYETS
jgi:hypothetical protein